MTDPAYISALAALIGTFVGGVTSIATSWLGQRYQSKEQRILREKGERQALYKQFIQEASKLYIDALEHSTTEIAKLVDVYATINRIRILSSARVVKEANEALLEIIDAYGNENRTFSDIKQSISDVRKSIHGGYPDPLQKFSEACHEELARAWTH
jgi:gas vesicle protein